MRTRRRSVRLGINVNNEIYNEITFTIYVKALFDRRAVHVLYNTRPLIAKNSFKSRLIDIGYTKCNRVYTIIVWRDFRQLLLSKMYSNFARSVQIFNGTVKVYRNGLGPTRTVRH